MVDLFLDLGEDQVGKVVGLVGEVLENRDLVETVAIDVDFVSVPFEDVALTDTGALANGGYLAGRSFEESKV